jgi:hypothetical protein
MISKKMTSLILFVLLCFGLVAYAPPALAGANRGEDPYPAGTGQIQARVQRTGLGSVVKMVVLYNADGGVVAEKMTSGELVSFSRLPAGHYHLVAYVDDIDISQSEDIVVRSSQTTQVSVQLKKPVSACVPSQTNAKTANVRCSTVTGEASMLKIAPFYTTTVVYMQCGKVVQKIGPDCGCRAGGWNYTTSCSKGNTIYVNLPCNRGSRP